MKRHTTYAPTLKEWREERHLSLRAAADLLGISFGYLNRVERGEQHLRGKLAKRISTLTGVPVTVLVGAE